MKKKLLILLLFAIVLLLPLFLFNYGYLKRYLFCAQLLIIILALIDFFIQLSKREHLKRILITIAGFIAVLGFVNFLGTNRLDYLEPIASAKANLKLNIKPISFEIQKNPWYAWIVLPKGKPFMEAKNPPITFGIMNKISHIELDFTLHEDSPVIRQPVDYVESMQRLEIWQLFMNRTIEVIDGKCVFTFNGKIKREYEIPPQKSQLNIIYFKIKER